MTQVARRIALGLVVLACACREPQKTVAGNPAVPIPEKSYRAGAEGLAELWRDILTAAQKDDRGRVHDLMSSMIMTDDDLVALFGSERAAYLKPRYTPMIARLVNIGAVELVAQILERKYDDIEVFPVDATQGPEAKATLESLHEQRPVFGVRVKKKTETRGLRYDFFVYRDARWMTGNQIAKHLVPEGTKPTPTSPPTAPIAPPTTPAAPPAAAPPTAPIAHP